MNQIINHIRKNNKKFKNFYPNRAHIYFPNLRINKIIKHNYNCLLNFFEFILFSSSKENK